MTILVVALSGTTHAQNVIQKAHHYIQTGGATPIDFPIAPFGAETQAAVANMTLHFPNGSTLPIPYVAGDDQYESLSNFSTKAALDAAYPAGTYTLTGTGLATVTLNLPADNYPTAVPQITNGTWNAGGVLVIDPTQSVTLNFNNFTTYASAGFAGHEDFELQSNANFEKGIATVAAFGFTVSATPFTTVTIPANTLPTGGAFRAVLRYDTLTTLDTSGAGTVVLFSNQLEFWIAALAPGTTAQSQPFITAQPADRIAALGGSATFTASVNLGSGNQAADVHWYVNGAEINLQANPKYTFVRAGNVLNLTVNNITSADLGTYSFRLADTGGITGSNSATLAIGTSTGPAIVMQPAGHSLATGSSVVFSVVASGGNLTYQWKKNGTNIPVATAADFMIPNAQPSDSANYTVTVTNGTGSATSNAANLTVAASSNPGRLVNASVRIVSGTDANVLIVGFVTGGVGTSGNKQLLIRGIGPTLAGFGVGGTMVDPLLEIIPGGSSTAVQSNDNWGGDASIIATANAIGAFALPSATSKDSALLATLAAGVYSAKVSGVGATSGTVLAELYDANPSVFNAATPRIINLSARAPMANDNPLIAGFVVGGTTAKTLLIRAIGPTLTGFGLPGAMSDPSLDIIPGGATVAINSNDNWGGSNLITFTGNRVGAFALPDPNSKDAVILVTLDPGVYSAKVLGVNNASGITLVEVYEIP
ncbi:MAG: peptidase and matrixin and adamalysin [Verrucomicrobia bacterium]|nr:peptidase and matrixin and adamalysin [Verrucomicrobiota bacterium]